MSPCSSGALEPASLSTWRYCSTHTLSVLPLKLWYHGTQVSTVASNQALGRERKGRVGSVAGWIAGWPNQSTGLQLRHAPSRFLHLMVPQLADDRLGWHRSPSYTLFVTLPATLLPMCYWLSGMSTHTSPFVPLLHTKIPLKAVDCHRCYNTATTGYTRLRVLLSRPPLSFLILMA